MTDQTKYQIEPVGNKPVFWAEITHKGRFVARLRGNDKEQLEQRAHVYAAGMNYKRAAVQVQQETRSPHHDH